MRIELTYSAWKAEVLPLNYTHIGASEGDRTLTLAMARLYSTVKLHPHLLVFPARFELTTPWLKVKCSTNWANFAYWCKWKDLNFRPIAYQAIALTNWATLAWYSQRDLNPYCRRERAVNWPLFDGSIWRDVKDLNLRTTLWWSTV